MDGLADYRGILRAELEERAARKVSYSPDMKNHLIINETETEFILIRFGWYEGYYKYLVLFHFEFIDDKIWLHQNNTDVEIGEILEEKGIPKSSIVVGFVAEYERGLEDHALA